MWDAEFLFEKSCLQFAACVTRSSRLAGACFHDCVVLFFGLSSDQAYLSLASTWPGIPFVGFQLTSRVSFCGLQVNHMCLFSGFQLNRCTYVSSLSFIFWWPGMTITCGGLPFTECSEGQKRVDHDIKRTWFTDFYRKKIDIYFLYFSKYQRGRHYWDGLTVEWIWYSFVCGRPRLCCRSTASPSTSARASCTLTTRLRRRNCWRCGSTRSSALTHSRIRWVERWYIEHVSCQDRLELPWFWNENMSRA